MNLSQLTPYLRPERLERLSKQVSKLEQATALRAIDLTGAKFVINNCVEEALKKFDDDNDVPYLQRQVLVMGAYNLNSALKEARRHGSTKRAAFIEQMVPLNSLLQSAKDLVVKRVPGVKTKEQVAREAELDKDRMTCQCCSGRILANTGLIAHHGYQRPGTGWQTASCFGARHLPFEADRKVLGQLIVALKSRLLSMRSCRRKTKAEELPIKREFVDYSIRENGDYGKVHLSFTRENFQLLLQDNAKVTNPSRLTTFDDLMEKEISFQDHKIKVVARDVEDSQARYDGWRKTHEYDGKKWTKIRGGKS